MVRVDRLRIRLVEFLNQGKDKAGIAPQLLNQIVPTGRDELARFCLTQQTAVFKGIADLGIQLVPVSQDNNGWRTGKLAADFLGQEHHGVAFAAALSMPENAQFSVVQLPALVSLDRLVDPEILVVPGENFGGMPAGVVIENEVFQQIQKVFLLADTPQHGFQGHTALVLLRKALPFVEKFIFAPQSTHLGLCPVGEDQKGVVIKQVWNGVQVVGIVVCVSIPHIYGVLFQLHKQQRQAIDKAHNIRPAAVQVSVDFQLLNGKEVVVPRILKVNHHSVLRFRPATGLFHRNGNSVPNQEVFFLIDLQQRGSGQVPLHDFLGFFHLPRGNPRIQPQQSLPKIPGQQNLFIAFAPKAAVFAQLFRIVGKGNLPPQLPLQQLAGGFLDEDIFGIVVAHKITCFLLKSIA